MPKPVRSRAVQPPIPNTIMKNLCLYRKIFLMETFTRKESRFQNRGIRSRRIRLPLLGAFGRISWAATSASSYRQVAKVVPMEHRTDTARDTAPSRQSIRSTKSPMEYMIP